MSKILFVNYVKIIQRFVLWNLRVKNLKKVSGTISIIIGIIIVTLGLYFIRKFVLQSEIYWKQVDSEVAQKDPSWKLVFFDNFHGNTLNLSKWEYQNGCGNTYGQGNYQCYVWGTNNIQVKNSTLTITSRIENFESKNFTSGRIRTIEQFKYGRFIIRAKLPKGKLLWPAIWLKKKSSKTNCYEEIDIMEYKGNEPKKVIFTSFHGPNINELVKNSYRTKEMDDFSEKFHEFMLEWTEGEGLTWFVDGKQYFHVPMPQVVDLDNKCQAFSDPENLILNMAVGGRMFGPNNHITVDEARKSWSKSTFEVDYVAVYQQKLILIKNL